MEVIRQAGEKVTDMMVSFGFDRSEVPKALIGFNALLWIEYGVFWALSFRFRPGWNLVHSAAGVRWRDGLRSKYKLYNRFEKRLERQAERLSENRFVKPMTNFLNVSSTQIVTTTVETGVIYNVMFPILIPSNVYLVKKYLDSQEK